MTCAQVPSPTSLVRRWLLCSLLPHGTKDKPISFGPKWCPMVTVTQLEAKLPLEDTYQGLSLFPLAMAEVWVPNLGSSDALSERKESSRGSSPPAEGASPHQLWACCPAQLTTSTAGPTIHPSPHRSEPGPCEKSPRLSAAGFSVPPSSNLLIENDPYSNSLG